MNGALGRERRADLAFLPLLFLLGLAPRLLAANLFAGEAVWDGHYYDFAAKRLADGFGYSDDLLLGGKTIWHPWCHYPVGYSAYLALFYKLVGKSSIVAHVVNAVTGALLPVVTWLLAKRALSPLRARVAGLLVALYPGLILYSALSMSEPLACLLTLSAFVIATTVEPRRKGIVLGALVLGFAALVRPQALLCAPLLPLVLEGERLLVRARWALLACAVTLLPVLPWTARNCRVMDSCALISTNGGWNLAIGAFPRATGRFETLRSSDGCSDVTGQVQQDRCWFAYGLSQIRSDPWRWLKLVPKKLSYTFDHESFAVEYLHEANPALWPDQKRTLVREILTASERLLVLGAALSIVPFPRRRRGALASGALLLVIGALAYAGMSLPEPTVVPLVLLVCLVPWLPLPGRALFPPALLLALALLATVVITHAVFFGEDRYHIVVTPVFCLLLAAALRTSSPPPLPEARG